jgi:hypothetical protein
LRGRPRAAATGLIASIVLGWTWLTFPAWSDGSVQLSWPLNLHHSGPRLVALSILLMLAARLPLSASSRAPGDWRRGRPPAGTRTAPMRVSAMLDARSMARTDRGPGGLHCRIEHRNSSESRH